MRNKKLLDPIATVGLGCRYPCCGTGPEAFWEMLREGKGGVRDIPPDRWDIERFYVLSGTTPGAPERLTGATN